MMFWLGLLLAICFVPGYTGASVPTQWALLSIVLPLGLWRVGRKTLLHKLFLCFMAYAILSLAWSHDVYTFGWGLWITTIWLLSFHLGTVTASLVSLWKGLAVGLSISSAVAVAQVFGFTSIEMYTQGAYSGLLFNSTLQGICIALVLIALVSHDLWWYTPPLALGLILSGSRSGLLILGIGLLVRYVHWLAAITFLILGVLIFTATNFSSDLERIQIWGVVFPTLNFFGHGVGSFMDLHYIDKAKDTLIHPEFAHNDILQLIYEFGIFALLPIGILGSALSHADDRNGLILLSFICLSLFFFPLYAPIPSFIGFMVAGHCTRNGPMAWRDLFRWRSDFLPRSASSRPRNDLDGSQGIPMVPRATHTEA